MKKLKKAKYYILALIIPLIICIIILETKNIFTNIENFFATDLKEQHLPFLNYMKNVLLGKTSIYYSFSAGMGSPMIATMIFYAISPINILLVLVNNIQYAILLIYICKISLSGLTMFIYLKNRRKKESMTTVVFSTCYALCSFSINYFFCIFWLDALYLTPLVMLGIDKIIEKEHINLTYILSLALTIICNIQMGFGLCIFSVIYFIYSFNMEYNIKKNIKKAKLLSLIFIISSLCAGAISSGALIGFITEYKKISIARNLIVLDNNTTNISYMLKNFFTVGNIKKNYYNEFEPFIYSGLIVSFSFILHLFSNNKKKKHILMLITIFVISFSIKSINTFWHLSNPVFLNYRYSIFFTAFLNMIAYESYCKKNKLTKKDLKILTTCIIVGLFMTVAFKEEVHTIYTLIFLILISLGIYLTKNKSKKFEIPLMLLVLIEIIVYGNISMYPQRENNEGLFNYITYSKMKELIKEIDLDDTYRAMYNYNYLEYANESLLYNKNSSLRYFSSVIDGNVITFLHRNMSKIYNNDYEISAYDSPLLISLLGNKYFLFDKEYNNSIYKKIKTFKIKYSSKKKNKKRDAYLYENPYALSIGYLINKDSEYKKEYDVVDYQNQIIKDFTGIDEDVMIRIDYKKDGDSKLCELYEDNSCQPIIFTNETNNSLIHIYGNWTAYSFLEKIEAYHDTNRPLTIKLKNKNMEIGLFSNKKGEVKYVIATYNEELLKKSLNTLQQNMLENINIDKNIMTGNINAKKEGILLLTIPYDNKFNIYIDGKKTKYFSTLNNTFIGLNMKSGEHKIKIEYIDTNLKWYIMSSLLSLVITILIYLMKKKKDLHKIT